MGIIEKWYGFCLISDKPRGLGIISAVEISGKQDMKHHYSLFFPIVHLPSYARKLSADNGSWSKCGVSRSCLHVSLREPKKAIRIP